MTKRSAWRNQLLNEVEGAEDAGTSRICWLGSANAKMSPPVLTTKTSPSRGHRLVRINKSKPDCYGTLVRCAAYVCKLLAA